MAASTCNGVAPTVQLSNSWIGNWSTFSISVGTPGQNFSVLPDLTGGEVWVPTTGSCPNNNASCAASRGVGPVNGTQSSGFSWDASSTWNQLGLYQLYSHQYLFGANNSGLYGLDTVALGQSNDFKIKDTAVAGYLSPDFWLGSFGLNVQSSKFTNRTDDVPSLLSSMKELKLTPSLSFGYSAGASYMQPSGARGSVIFGGYDQAQFASDTITYPIKTFNDTGLVVSLQGIVAANTLSGFNAVPIPTSGMRLALDSSTAELWLPEVFCETFVGAFGLVKDNNTGFYLITPASRQKLLNSTAQLTFTLVSDAGALINIVFPYAAFDQMIGYPVYDSNAYYFPIRQAINESQYVLGRTFLQEAYVVVDWERGNFTIGQSSHKSNVPQQLVTICPPSPSPKLSRGEIAGIVVAVVVGVTLLVAALWFAWSRWQKKRKMVAAKSPNMSVSELEDAQVVKSEIMSNTIHELADPDPQLASTPIFELMGSPTQTELPGSLKRPY